MTDNQSFQTGAAASARRPAGAVAAGHRKRRKRGLWWLLAAVIAVALIALLIALSSGGDSSKHRGVASTPAASAPASSTAAAARPATAPAATAPAAASGSGASTGSGLTALVGGGGVAAKPAAGTLAAAGSIGIVLFAEARTRLDPNTKAVIATAVKDIRASHARSVTVVGYTDKIGNSAANRALSLERARTVVAAMRRQLEDPSVSFRAEARGETHPVAPNTTPQGRQLDRRVTIFIAH